MARRRKTWHFRLDEATTLGVSPPDGLREKQVRRRGRWSLILGTLIGAATLVAVAYADTITPDGDTLTNNDQSSVSLGTVAPGAVLTPSTSFRLTCTGKQHPDEGQTISLTFSLGSSTVPAGGSLSATTASIGPIPASWPDDTIGGGSTNCSSPAQTKEDNGNSTVTITAPATPGDYTYVVVWNFGLSPADPDSGGDASALVGSNTNVTYTLTVASSDTTPPDSASVLIDDGAAWTNSATGSVLVDISAHDAVGVTRYRLASSQAGLDSASDVAVSPAEVNFSRADLPFTLVTGEGASKAVWARFCDAAGNCTDASDTIGWDKTAPTITDAGVQSGTAGTNGWYTSAVVNRFQASDALSGLDSACIAAFPSGNRDVSTGASEGANVTVNSGPCSDVAGNTNPGVSSATFKIDLMDPSVAITSPSNGLTTIATSIAVSGTASDTPSGIDNVKVNTLLATYNGGTGTWSRSDVPLNCGANTITAVATDVAGRTSSDSITVNRLCFTLQYLQPIDQSYGAASYVINKGKYGRVIPIKVIVYLNGVPQTDADLAGYGLTLQIGVNGVSCSGGAASDAVEAYADAGSANGNTNLFRWLFATNNSWGYNLDTGNPPGVAMTIYSCYRLDVYVDDGTNHVKISNSPYAIFQPTK